MNLVHFLSVLAVVLAGAIPTLGAPEAAEYAFEMMRARVYIDNAIFELSDDGPTEVDQPPCSDVPAGYYIFCFKMAGAHGERRLDDFEAVVHPLIGGYTVGELADVPGVYEATWEIQTALDACDTCEPYALASYAWDNDLEDDAAGQVGFEPSCLGFLVIKTSLVKRSSWQGDDYYCGMQIAEEPVQA